MGVTDIKVRVLLSEQPGLRQKWEFKVSIPELKV